MDKKQVRAIMEDLEKHLREFAEKHNVIVEVQGSRYNEMEIRPKIKITTKEEGQTDEQVMAEAFRFKAELMGIDPEWYGKEITVNGSTPARIIRIDEKKRKYPVIVKAIHSDAMWKLSVDQVEMRLS